MNHFINTMFNVKPKTLNNETVILHYPGII